jgi:hypothetical protein
VRACAAAVPALDAVFACCRGYPERGAADVESWIDWMRARSRRAAAFHCGYRGIPKRQVDNDGAVHDAIRELVDQPGTRNALSRLAPDQIRAVIAANVARARPELDVSPLGDDAWRRRIGKALWIAVAIALLPVLVVGVPLWWVVLRRHEATDPVPGAASRPVHDDANHHLDEDACAQNQLSHLVDIKPGWFRLVTAWGVLAAIDAVASVVCVDGELGGITGTHFARWVILADWRDAADIPTGRRRRHRLLFLSSYDGSWESYVGEFVDRASSGLTAVWSNTVDFPRTERLTRLGSRDEEAFKQWARDHQIRTQVWWTGVPRSTVRNIRDAVDLRRDLARPMEDEEARAWLRKL